MKKNKRNKQIKTGYSIGHGVCDFMEDGISIQDTDFMVLYQNKVHKKIMGDHIGEFCYKAFEHRDTLCQGCPLDMVFRDGKVHKTERCVNNDKKALYIEVTASPLLDSTGEIIAGVEIVRNITRRKQIEEDLKRRIEELERFYDMAVNRELRIKELKDRVKQLELKLSRNTPTDTFS